MTGYGRNQFAGAGKKQKEEGSLRLLTPGEIVLARLVFRSTIPYEKVWIHHDSFLPFGLQNKQTKSLSLSFCVTALSDVTDRMPRTRGLLSV